MGSGAYLARAAAFSIVLATCGYLVGSDARAESGKDESDVDGGQQPRFGVARGVSGGADA